VNIPTKLLRVSTNLLLGMTLGSVGSVNTTSAFEDYAVEMCLSAQAVEEHLEGIPQSGEQMFSADNFGQFPKRMNQSTYVKERLMTENPRFEPLRGYGQASRLRQASQPVGLLDLLHSSSSGTCTAFLIENDLLLTNAHCISDDVREAKFFPDYLDVDGLNQQGFAVAIVPIEIDSSLDYAILRVNGAPGDVYGTVKLSAAVPPPGDDLSIFHHPLGQPKSVTRQDCRVKSLQAGGLLAHLCDTLPGSSGSPVLTGDSQHVIALHHSGAGSNRDPVNLATTVAAIAKKSPIIARLVRNDPQSITANRPPVASTPTHTAKPATLTITPGATTPPEGKTAAFTLLNHSADPLRVLARYRDVKTGEWKLTGWKTIESNGSTTIQTVGNHIFTYAEVVGHSCAWGGDAKEPNDLKQFYDGRTLLMERETTSYRKTIQYKCRLVDE
jgi:hypothetical protein